MNLNTSPRYFKLAGTRPIPCAAGEWPGWFELHEAERTVGMTDVGDSFIVTQFIGLDLPGREPPLLWETLVRGGPLHGEGQRYSSWEAAEAGHREMVERAMRAIGGKPRHPRENEIPY